MNILKYCMSGRQPLSILKKADEIRIDYKDKNRILDFIEAIPDKTVILDLYDIQTIDWQTIKMYAEKIDLILCIYNLYDDTITKCKEYNLRFFWGYPIDNFYKLDSILKLQPCYIYLTAPLSFNLKKIKNIARDVAIRLCPNVAYNDNIPRDNGLIGQWVRPDDVKLYEEYVDTMEFITKELRREAALLHIYQDNQTWPNDLSLIIDNLDMSIDNTVLPDEFGEQRMNCGQRCAKNHNCHFCEVSVRFTKVLRNAKQKKKN